MLEVLPPKATGRINCVKDPRAIRPLLERTRRLTNL